MDRRTKAKSPLFIGPARNGVNMWKTECWKCHELLTTQQGMRVKSAIFDSMAFKGEPKKTVDKATRTVWALCEDCHSKLVKQTPGVVSV